MGSGGSPKGQHFRGYTERVLFAFLLKFFSLLFSNKRATPFETFALSLSFYQKLDSTFQEVTKLFMFFFFKDYDDFVNIAVVLKLYKNACRSC